LEGTDKRVAEDFLGFHLPACHVKSEREYSMAMAFIRVAALLRGGGLGKIQHNSSVLWVESAQFLLSGLP
jgi:hypothetical protein